MVKMQEDLMLAKLNENASVASAKDHRQRLMEMETQVRGYRVRSGFEIGILDRDLELDRDAFQYRCRKHWVFSVLSPLFPSQKLIFVFYSFLLSPLHWSTKTTLQTNLPYGFRANAIFHNLLHLSSCSFPPSAPFLLLLCSCSCFFTPASFLLLLLSFS